VATAIVNRRVISGWRTQEINEYLDLAVSRDGYIDRGESEEKMLDTLGRRHRKYKDKAEKERIERIRYKDQIKERDAAKYQRFKDEHAKYSLLYCDRYPDSSPCSVNQFSKSAVFNLWKVGDFEAVLQMTFGLGDKMKKRQANGWDSYRDQFYKK